METSQELDAMSAVGSVNFGPPNSVMSYGQDAANVLFHVINHRHLKKRPMIFTPNKPLNEWGKVLHDEDLGAAILDRVLERGRFIQLDGSRAARVISSWTRYGLRRQIVPEFPEKACQNFRNHISTSSCSQPTFCRSGEK